MDKAAKFWDEGEAFREYLRQLGHIKKFEEEEVILGEDSHVNSIPFVLSGSIKVMRTHEDGREILLYYIRSGESCIMSFLAGLHRNTSKIKAIAEEPTQIAFIPVEKVVELIRNHPSWLDYILRQYHQRFEELLEAVETIAFKKVDERLLLLLQKKSELTASRNLYVTHEQLSNELGTARAVVSRLLKQLEASGILKLSRNKITLV